MSLSKLTLKKNQKARQCRVLAFFVLFMALFSACSFDEDTGSYQSINEGELLRARVIKVKDGDSVVLRLEDTSEREARLFGIDAPDYRYLQKIKILGVVA